ncbi:Similar to Multidrug resistance protein fnx1; acc. no. Q09752 [Pyronema omphalodes CBS 100304]|uniref:Similar to Multidrug resistance protein fnx1 acc. no. Q09752 n=1 Tax=Pyronema omphalodes (strain CBS 100304) TaxID=1076935 RepID=U4LST0_PYROM|nr:Similar to Multidrug resistance protein fnx1; acc. no. Q09752 [Pyronema omphalodes CBS 100304]
MSRHDEPQNADESSPLLPDSSNDTTNEAPIAEELSLPKLLAVLSSIWIGVFLAALDGTVISTLLAPISSEFNSFASLSWITTAYLIAQAALQPLFGKLTDIYGRRNGLLVSNGLFILGTAMCGLATSEGFMIVGRVIAGAGGGGLFSISSIVGTDLVPLRKRGIVQGGGNIAFGVGASLGDPIHFHLCPLRLPLRPHPDPPATTSPHKRVDYLGSLSMVLFLTIFLLALNTGGSLLPWSHPLVLICLPLSCVFLGLFIYTELHWAKEPIIPLGIFSDLTVASACLTYLFLSMSVYCAYFFLPIYSQLRGLSATAAGLHLTTYPIGISVGSLGSGIIMNKTGRYYWLGVSAIVLYCLGAGLFCTFNLTTPDLPQYVYLFFFGTGYGATLTTVLLALIAAVKHEEQATTTSASYLFRSTGGTIGAAAGAAVFQTALRSNLVKRLGDSEAAREVIEKVLEDFSEIGKVAEKWKIPVVEAYMGSVRLVFITAFAFGVLGVITTVMMREHKLHSTLNRK